MNTQLSNSRLLDREPTERPDTEPAVSRPAGAPGNSRPDAMPAVDADWLAEVLDDAGLRAALLLLGDTEPHRLE
ncbi:MAG: hypothetical protein M3N57_13245, partial [Actinomycetota bacterium]|nr:hypothetical protein [Actinomycetota bacterium]